MGGPDCCNNTLFKDNSGIDIPLNLSPQDVIRDYPNSELASLLSNEPRFYTTSDIDEIDEIIDPSPWNASKFPEPSIIKIGDKTYDYANFYRISIP